MMRLKARVAKLEVRWRPDATSVDFSTLADHELRFIASLSFDRDGLPDVTAMPSADLDQLERVTTKLKAAACGS